MRHPKKKLDALEARPRKSFSQNFLTSPAWQEKLALAACLPDDYDVLWEVGPGLGAITTQLLAHAPKPLTLFEIDRKLAENLRNTWPQVPLNEGDFLEVDIPRLAGGQRIALLSNLPYHISTPILFKLLESRVHFRRLVLTFQREVAVRLRAAPRTSDYSALSVLVQNCFEIRSLGVIPPGAFYPPPQVDSEGLLFTPLPDTGLPYESLRLVVKQAFLHRRKKVTSNLAGLFTKDDLLRFLQDRGLTPNARPEELSTADYRDLALRVKGSP